MTILYILLAILIFGVLIGIHEFGHFLVAKACGVRVEEFAVGMGPALWKKKKGETVYALRALPIGGYCAMAGEDASSEDPRAFTNAVWWKRLLILCAGSAMNFLLGFLVVLLLYSSAAAFHAPILSGFMEGCPYEGAEALQVGDRFYKIDGHRIYETYDVSDFLSRGDGVYDVVVLRGGKKVELKSIALEPLEYEGYENKMYGFFFGVEEATPLVKLRRAWESCIRPRRHRQPHGRDRRTGGLDRGRALRYPLSGGLYCGEPRHHEHAADPGARRRPGIPAAGDRGDRGGDAQEARPQVRGGDPRGGHDPAAGLDGDCDV